MEQIICDGKGYGKRKNPYGDQMPIIGYTKQRMWSAFDRQNPPLPTFLPNDSEFLDEGCFEGEVVWQFWHPEFKRWEDSLNHKVDEVNGYKTRQIFRIHLPDKNVQVEEKRAQIENQLSDFRKVTLPVIEWLNKNHHPNTTIIISGNNAELLEGILSVNKS